MFFIHLLCIFFLFLQAHTAIGKVFGALELTMGINLPNRDKIFHAYSHFEALTSHECSFFCYNCGHHPPVLVMDLHKKGLFSMPGKYFYMLLSYITGISDVYQVTKNIEEQRFTYNVLHFAGVLYIVH